MLGFISSLIVLCVNYSLVYLQSVICHASSEGTFRPIVLRGTFWIEVRLLDRWLSYGMHIDLSSKSLIHFLLPHLVLAAKWTTLIIGISSSVDIGSHRCNRWLWSLLIVVRHMVFKWNVLIREALGFISFHRRMHDLWNHTLLFLSAFAQLSLCLDPDFLCWRMLGL
jgi:hypothetical protein